MDHIKSRGSCPGTAVLHLVPGLGMHGTVSPPPPPPQLIFMSWCLITDRDNFALCVKEIDWGGGVEWIHLAEHRDQCQCKLPVPQKREMP